MLTKRNIEILKIIIEEYLENGELIWSKSLLKKYDLWVSPATVRNDMWKLEELELIFQPYHSAWRLPTSKWLRAFVDYMMEQKPDFFLWPNSLNIKKEDLIKFEDYIHQIVYNLANNTKEISFFVIKESSINKYSWVADFLKTNHKHLWESIFNIIKMLEDKYNFIKFISSLPIKEWVNVFIWEENISPALKDYSLIVKPVMIEWKLWYIWIIWWLKMDYSYNISVVRWIV